MANGLEITRAILTKSSVSPIPVIGWSNQGEYMKAWLPSLVYPNGKHTQPRKEPRMKEYIAFDSHKHYTLVEQEDQTTGRTRQCRLTHHRGVFVEYLKGCCSGSRVAVEAT